MESITGAGLLNPYVEMAKTIDEWWKSLDFKQKIEVYEKTVLSSEQRRK